MAKKAPQRSAKPLPQQPKPASPTKGNAAKPANEHLMPILYIIAVGVAVYAQSCANNQFTDWDDPGYVLNNPLIKDLSPANIARIFNFSNAIMGNYHPLTIFTYAIDYAIDGLNAATFHWQSLLFHIATCIMAYFFTSELSRHKTAGLLAALLFVVHPMHVESVAWVPGRKDVVYGLFFVSACWAFLRYIRNESRPVKQYILALVLFIASLLGKPVAVSLPVTLVLIAFVEDKLADKRLWAAYVPFFALALMAGLKSVYDQKHFGALGTQMESYAAIERIALAGYALITYLWKMVVPVHLLCFYPYPLKVDDHIHYVYYIYPLLAVGLGWAVWRFLRQHKIVVFGLLFFLVNIALLLQLLPVGGAIVADRYSYIPYLGLMISIAVPAASLSLKSYIPNLQEKAGVIVVGVFIAICALLCYNRSLVWHDTTTLWRDEIALEPIRVPTAYNNLGYFYFSKFNESSNPKDRRVYYDSAQYLLQTAIGLQPKYVNPYISLGELERTNGEYEAAMKNYKIAISLDKSEEQVANAYLGMAIVYSIKTMTEHRFWDSAAYYYRNTLRLKSYYPEAHSNLGNLFDMIGNTDSALYHYGMAVQQNPDITDPYLNRGRALMRKGKFQDALKDLDKCIALSPERGEYYYTRAYCQLQMGNKPAAKADIQKAQSYGFNAIDPSVLQQLQ